MTKKIYAVATFVVQIDDPEQIKEIEAKEGTDDGVVTTMTIAIDKLQTVANNKKKDGLTFVPESVQKLLRGVNGVMIDILGREQMLNDPEKTILINFQVAKQK